jgi:hypothetical protein
MHQKHLKELLGINSKLKVPVCSGSLSGLLEELPASSSMGLEVPQDCKSLLATGLVPSGES